MKFSSFPILKILIPYVLGVFCAYFINFPHQISIFCFLLVLILIIISCIFNAKVGFFRQKIAHLSLFSALLIIGFLYTFLPFQYNHYQSKQLFDPENLYWQVKIVENPVVREKTVKVIAALEDCTKNQKIAGKVMLYFQRDTLSQMLEFGDILLIQTELTWISPPKNPEEFDYRSFMKRKGVYFTGYLPTYAWSKVQSSRFSLKKFSSFLQAKFSTLFANAGLSGEEYSIATAILLGNDETMEADLKSAYAAAGVSHILCVSGMHVGIIFMILNYVLMPLDLSKRLRWIKSLILFTAIWLYANITGLSPSVMRAAMMFSFVLIGNHLRRNTNIFHSLFASVFILLIINPLLIFELGFQLSYLAVVGIVLLQKPIFSIWQVKTKVGSYFWNLASVSIAAQIATFPITIYYFGIFPNYFLLANLSVIMLSFVVVISGVLVLVFSFSSFCSLWLGKLLTLEIKGMNIIIRFIEKLPYSVTENISINFSQVVFLYVAIAFLFFFFRKQKFYNFFIALIAILGVFSFYTMDKIRCRKEKSIIVYSIPKFSVIGFNCQGKTILLCDSLFSKNDKEYLFSIKNHERKRRICSSIYTRNENLKLDNFLKINNFILFEGKILYLHSGKEALYSNPERMSIDYLIVSHNARQNLEEIGSVLSCRMIIIDGTNSAYYERLWIAACEKNKIPYYSLRKSDFAFQVDLSK